MESWIKGKRQGRKKTPRVFAFLDELEHFKHKMKSVYFTSEPLPRPVEKLLFKDMFSIVGL